MKINGFIALSCCTISLVPVSYANFASAQNSEKPTSTEQSTTQEQTSAIKNQAEKLVELFFAQKFDSFGDFVIPEIKASVAPERMEESWHEIKSENGAFIKIAESKVINTPASDLVTLTLEFEQVTQDWIFIFNDEQKIVGVNAPISKGVKAIADEFINAVIEGDYEQARIYFHPFLKETIFPQNIESSWNQLISKNGKFEKIKNISLTQGSIIERTDLVKVALEFSKTEEEILIIFDSSRNIIGVDFVEQ